MLTATYLKTADTGQEPDKKGVAIVDVDGIQISISYWPSLISQWGIDGVKAYVEAEALYKTGNYDEAREKAMDGIPAPFGQSWANEHPDIVQGLG